MLTTAFLIAAALPMSGGVEISNRAATETGAEWEATPEALFHRTEGNPVVSATTEPTFVLRGQSPGYDEDPRLGGNLNQQQYLSPPVAGQGFPWPEGGAISAGTPWPSPNAPFAGTYPGTTVYGANGPQPVRFGWTTNADIGFLAKERTSGGVSGQFGVFEVNTEARYTMPTPNQWIFSIAPQFNFRLWDGPTLSQSTAMTIPGMAAGGNPDPGTLNTTLGQFDSNDPAQTEAVITTATTTGLPGEVYRLGADLKLVSPTLGPYTLELGFTPSLNTDFEESASQDAWVFDARGALIIRTSPRWMWVLGATFWDRVEDRVLPYAGVVYTPNDWLEVRALFPRGDISMFMGTPWGVPQWLYVAGEYHIEAYQLQLPVTERTTSNVTVPNSFDSTRTLFVRDRIELEDWRVLGGIRSEYNGMTSFLEAGWVFGRQVQFARSMSPSGFDISSGFIARFGLRF